MNNDTVPTQALVLMDAAMDVLDQSLTSLVLWRDEQDDPNVRVATLAVVDMLSRAWAVTRRAAAAATADIPHSSEWRDRGYL